MFHKGNASGLPQALRTAQEAIHLPEVQEMVRRLSEYKLGIFMPHMHDEQTGEFHPLPDEVMQVESGLGVSFRPTEEIAKHADRFLPVGWFWRGGAPTLVAACEMVWEEGTMSAAMPAWFCFVRFLLTNEPSTNNLAMRYRSWKFRRGQCDPDPEQKHYTAD